MSSDGIEATSTRSTEEPMMETKRRRTGKEGSVAGDGTIALEALDCTVCYHPLRPPVFQCAVGHVICSSCHDKLKNKNKCHACATTGGYNRCIAIDHILESVQAPCSNSIYGCTVKTRYLERQEHEKSCALAPCFCPEAGCGFAGLTTQLLHHLTDDHNIPVTEFPSGWCLTLEIQQSMRVLHMKEEEGGPMFLAKFTPVLPFGNVVSILCVDPHAVPGERKFRCEVDFYCNTLGLRQLSNFQIVSTSLSDGFPAELGSNPFLVPTGSSNSPTTSSSLTIRIAKIIHDRPISDWRWKSRS
ncbi:putative E3 ubiquitin-protein ligase SINA-like 6 [Triticum urartu]|nr:putative E3 ubiquitin-protein ligase SINA-like 6 [Triticum urartu]